MTPILQGKNILSAHNIYLIMINTKNVLEVCCCSFSVILVPSAVKALLSGVRFSNREPQWGCIGTTFSVLLICSKNEWGLIASFGLFPHWVCMFFFSLGTPASSISLKIWLLGSLVCLNLCVYCVHGCMSLC